MIEPSEISAQQLLLHFETIDSSIELDTFLITAAQTKEIFASFNKSLFEDKLLYKLYLLPPKSGSFESIFLVSFTAVGSILAFSGTDVGKAFIRGLTGHEPIYWAEQAGAYIRRTLNTAQTSFQDIDFSEYSADLRRRIEELIISKIVEGFLSLSDRELLKIGLDFRKFREAYNAKNLFYMKCIEDKNILGMGFDEDHIFPIQRRDFPKLIVNLPPAEPDESPQRWRASLAELKVTSPNWDRYDKNRFWKAKDQNGKDKLFRIDDERFWSIADDGNIFPHIIDTMKVQWIFETLTGRPKDFRVIRVLKYNDTVIGQPLTEIELKEICSRYGEAAIDNDDELLDLQPPPDDG